MPPDEYARKRDFQRTPEPAPAADSASRGAAGGYFCVQRHSAHRLHYDFRLEIGGALKSWAVPKGPSLLAGAKILAVRVEDHPLDYGAFEGNIPEGNYGAGSVMLWDRGRWELLGEPGAEEQLARGDLKFRLHGEKLRGAFALVHMKGRGKGNEWLLIKKSDGDADPHWNIEEHARSVLTGRSQEEIAADLPAAAETRSSSFVPAASIPGAVRAPMPGTVAPMRATPAATPPEGEDWLYAIKWGGVRALCFFEGGQVRIVSRRGGGLNRRFPELLVLPRRIRAETAIPDGAIVVLDEMGRPGFDLIQLRIGAAGAAAVAQLARETPATLFAFDLLYLDGYDLRRSPLAERRRALRNTFRPCGRLRYSEHVDATGGQVLEAARENALEGIVAKRAGSRYRSRRNPDWVKVKVVNQQEFVICGAGRAVDFAGAPRDPGVSLRRSSPRRPSDDLGAAGH